MPNESTLLVPTLERTLGELAHGATGELSRQQARNVRWMIRDQLKISDSPSSREPFAIADFIYWNCWSLSREATERWLASLRAEDLAALCFGEVLETLAPGLDWQMNLIAAKNEGKLFYLAGGSGGPIMEAFL